MGQTIDRMDLITAEDLLSFKIELLAAIRLLIGKDLAPHKRWLKSAEVCKNLGISAGKLSRLREARKLPFTKVGGSIYFDQADLDELFEKGKRFGN